jgi:hypothetical protein
MALEAEAVMFKELPVAFNALADVSPKDPARYRAGTYMEGLYAAFYALREVLGWDAEWNPSYAEPLLKNDFGEKYCGTARDLLAIASAANEFEGSRFFDHETRRWWRRGVDRLCESVEHANGVSQFFSEPQHGQWLNYLQGSDFGKAGSIDPLSLLPDSLRNVQAVRDYLYEATVKPGGIELLTDEDQKRQVAQQLGIQHPYQL